MPGNGMLMRKQACQQVCGAKKRSPGNPGLCHMSDLKTGQYAVVKERGGGPRKH